MVRLGKEMERIHNKYIPTWLYIVLILNYLIKYDNVLKFSCLYPLN